MEQARVHTIRCSRCVLSWKSRAIGGVCERLSILLPVLLLLLLGAGGLSPVGADVVILNPGEIQGTVQIGTTPETNIERFRIYAYDVSDSSQMAEKYIYPDPPSTSVPYSVTVNVPVGGVANYDIRTQRHSSEYVYMDNYRDRVSFPYQSVAVDDVTPSTADFIIADPGFIEGTVTVTGGGEIERVVIYAYQPSGSPEITSHTDFQGSQSPYPEPGYFRFPVAPNTGIILQHPSGTNINYYGSRVYLQGGAVIELPVRTVDVDAGETVTVDYTIVTPTSGSVEGSIELPGSGSVDQYYLRMYGTAEQTLYLTPPFGPGNATTYVMEDLPGGTIEDPVTGYNMQLRAYFDGYSSYLLFPYSLFDPTYTPGVVAGVATEVNISSGQAYINGTVVIDGVASLSDLTSASVSYSGQYLWDEESGSWGGPTYGGSARDTTDTTSGAYNLIVTPGSWNPSYLQLSFYDPDPASYLNAYINLYDYQREPVTLAAAGNVATRNLSYKTGSVAVTFQVLGGGLLSSPSLEGSCRLYEEPGDSSSTLLSYYSFNSRNSGQVDVAEGEVILIGMEGTCDVIAKATVDGSITSFGELTVDIVPGAGQVVDIGGPALVVEFPEPDACSDVSSLTVSGVVTDDVAVASVTVNGVAASLTSTSNPDDVSEMTFEAIIPLVSGSNQILTLAEDTSGKQSTDTRNVVIDSADNDLDGVIDCNDNCLGVENADQIDIDEDGVGSACEECDDDPDKTESGVCGCGTADYDTDVDGVLDCDDGCPTDGSKTEPGVCGCGNVDDGDGDGHASCQGDCDDEDADINPDEDEVCDEVDHDCDYEITNGFSTPYPDCLYTDTDGDGVGDDLDQCPGTPSGESVDSNGCSASQRDTDGDGVTDDQDQCPGTAAGATCDSNGCSASQRDTDGDGVTDDQDQCPGTAAGATCDSNGCSASQRDSDGDGVTDDQDQCPGTAAGATCDSNGCSASQRDSDGDGVTDDQDQCPGTPSGEAVDSNGCSDSQKDTEDCDIDGDGDVDRYDIDAIFAARNQSASGPDDLRDANGDGLITVNDGRLCVLECTNPSCAPSLGQDEAH